jgi:hypothetical protein
MTCKLNADTTDGLKLVSDTSGEIDIQSNGTTSINFSPSQITITDSDSGQPRLLLKNTNADSTSSFLDFQKDSASPADNDVIGKMRFIGDDDGGNTVAYATIASTSPDVSNGSENGDLRFETTVDGTNAERMRIHSNGNVGIGTSSPEAILHVSTGGGIAPFASTQIISESTGNNYIELNGGNTSTTALYFGDSNDQDVGGILYNHSNNSMSFRANASERMRISADGRIGVAVSGISAVQFGMKINGQSWFAVWDDDAGNDKFRVASSGNVQNANNSYGAISDQKLKENIVDTSNKLEDLKRVQVKNYNFIGDSQKQIGVIAQELETVFPSMVEEHPDLDEDGNDLGTVTKSVKYSVFVPILIKALQEQQTIIEDLQTRITALENN